MTTVLFIHGTGVREPGFTRTLDRINAGLAKVRPGLHAQPCYWGHKGAELAEIGAAFYFDKARLKSDRGDGPGDLNEERQVALWDRLADDPFYEIRMRQFKKPPRGKPGPSLKDRVLALLASDDLAAEVKSLGMASAFEAAVRAVTASQDFRRAFDRSTAVNGNVVEVIARALVAYSLATVAADGITVSGEHRDRFAAAIIRAFGVADQGLPDELAHMAKAEAWWGLHPFIRDRRRRLVDQLADIALYQARGQEIRDFVRGEIRRLDGPVVLLAHSLGGIVAFDLLAGEDTDGLEQVQMLITVGSQVPLLYEVNALTCLLSFPDKLPDTFKAKWINVYDKRDLLAYGGGELFHGQCQDVEVNTKVAFPASHDAYWDTSNFYRQLSLAMRAENL